MARSLTPAELARLLHDSYLEGYGPPLPEGQVGAKSWDSLTQAQRRQYAATARVLLRRLTITAKEKDIG